MCPRRSLDTDAQPAAPKREPGTISRRALLAGTAGAMGAAVFHDGRTAHASSAPSQAPADPTKVQGGPASPLGARARSEQPRRMTYGTPNLRVSLTPHQDLSGVITPADLHFERHHAGIPQIDPTSYSVLIHGMVERPTVFTLDDLKRFPARSRICFMECAGNGGNGYRGLRPDRTPQEIDGLTSNSEWIGVPLASLLREVGVRSGASWFLAEGMDAAVMTRSIPMAKAYDDAMVAYGQNGEAIRPEQGYPARLLLPGWEGSSNVKWLRRIEISDRPFMTREETAKYADPLKNGTARLFSFEMDAKSMITFPAYPVTLSEPGWWEIQGLAWSGRGRITRVDVSVDGGRSWRRAQLDEPVLPKAHTRFRLPWNWRGAPALLMSRAVDETGYVQPSLEQLRDARGIGTHYHFNNIRAWQVGEDGSVAFGLEG